jgi:alkylation response protein AidB-like acyl-CoA dehydrogenase
MFCLARTRFEGKPQSAISFLLMDMHAPGITVEPKVSMDDGHYLNNVFMDDVKVPLDDRIGAENDGWTYAKFLLSNERTGSAGVGRSKQRISQLKDIARQAGVVGESLLDNPGFSLTPRARRSEPERA